jgi:hypothetical protein
MDYDLAVWALLTRADRAKQPERAKRAERPDPADQPDRSRDVSAGTSVEPHAAESSNILMQAE